MLGSTMGFLVHNFNPAKIFMGDTGSLFLGFTISVIALLGFKATTLTSLVIPICILAIPIFDTALAILRRLIKGEGIMSPDKEHFHHQLLKMNFSQRKTVLIVYAINILFSIAAIIYTIKNAKLGIVIYITLFVLVVWFVLHTSIISDKLETKTKDLENKFKNKKRKK
jgi:UDP-GlcNAc:undecaprenyl-phosphate GlcNAc-1-phosphate transferase